MSSFQNKYAPEPGRLLISEPFLQDANFHRTVILLTEHNEQSSVGFILNRALPLELKEVLELPASQEITLHLGGPVQHNTLHYIHRDEHIAASSRKIGNGLYWGGDFEYISQKIESGTLDESLYRFYLGYSGWTAGQLENELAENTWIVGACTPDMIFGMDEETMWQHILNDMGGVFSMLSKYPESPQLN
jgi:putative transcriptional regulator